MTRRDFTKGLFAAGLSAGGPQFPEAAAESGARGERSLDPLAIGVISDIHTGMPRSRQKYRTGREYPWQPDASKRLVDEILALPNPPATQGP